MFLITGLSDEIIRGAWKLLNIAQDVAIANKSILHNVQNSW